MQQDLSDEITRERWRRAFELCEACAALPAPQRARHIQTACQGDPLLLSCVQQLLSAETVTETDGFLDTPAWSYTPPVAAPQAALGQTAGAYRITQFLDRGGMGEIYLARRVDGMFDRQVAVKLIRADLNAKEYRRFRREVQILADLKHANLVTLYDAGRLSDGRPYLVMEYVEGENLRDWLQARPTPPRETIGEIMRQACAGLQAAHQADVIHRDIKPANFIVQEQDGQLAVKLLDFGIAYRHEPWQTDQTKTGGAIGTVGYMSPEQLHGTLPEQLTVASDVYSLGLVCYEMLTGQPAYAGYSQAEIIAKRVHQPLLAPSARRPELGFSPTLDRVMMKALANAPQDRYPSALTFARELTEALRETGSQIVPPVPPPDPPIWKWLGLTLLGLALLAAGWFVWRGKTPPAPVDPWAQEQPPVPQPTGLRVNLGIRRSSGVDFSGCQFALFKPAAAMTAIENSDNTLILLQEVGADGHSRIVKDTPVSPGDYAMRFECRGFQTVAKPVTVVENPQRPGWATVAFDLKPE